MSVHVFLAGRLSSVSMLRAPDHSVLAGILSQGAVV